MRLYKQSLPDAQRCYPTFKMNQVKLRKCKRGRTMTATLRRCSTGCLSILMVRRTIVACMSGVSPILIERSS